MPLLPPACRVCTTCRRSLLSLSEPEPARENCIPVFSKSSSCIFTGHGSLHDRSDSAHGRAQSRHRLLSGSTCLRTDCAREVLPIRLVEPIPEREICLIRDTKPSGEHRCQEADGISAEGYLKRRRSNAFSGTKCALAAHLRLPWQAA